MAEALRLADELDEIHTTHVARNAAAELRRLHELLEAEQALLQRVIYPELQRLRTQRDALLEALKAAEPYLRHADVDYNVYVQCRAAIALIEGRVKAVKEGK